jgi:hypothetical protein
MWRLLLAAALLAVAAAPTEARMHAPYRGHRIIPANAAPPLDGLAAPGGAYSLRKLKSTYAGPAIRLRRASDNLETDINFLGFTGFTGAPLDTAAALAHCASTTCFLSAWYDQSGLARHLVQATAAAQPTFVFNCIGAQPCIQTTTGAITAASVASVTPATGVVSFSVVANRPVGTAGFCGWARQNGIGNRITTNNVLNQWGLVGGTSGNLLVTAADNAWHSVQAVLNGAASNVLVDGVNTTGTATGNTVAGTAQIIGGGGGVTCYHVEAVIWDNYVLTAGEQAALTSNQRGFWGF